MSLSLDLVLDRVRQASPREFEDFARKLAQNLSQTQLDIVEQVVEQERQRRQTASTDGANRRWGI